MAQYERRRKDARIYSEYEAAQLATLAFVTASRAIMKFTRTIGLLASAIAVADFSHALPSSTHGSTHNHGHGHLNNVTAAFGDVDDLVLRRQADSSTPELRILALGASIVYGADESHKNG